MHIVHGLEDFNPPWEKSALTLGVFDGMHRGHQALVSRLSKRSRKDNAARILVTYNPHPDQVLGKRTRTHATELFTLNERIALFQKFELDAVIFLPFTMELARMTALRYLKEILLGRLKAGRIIIGYDQCFGRGRKGDYKFLRQMSRRYSFKVEQIGVIRMGGEVISTSRIRSCLALGQVEKANRMLGHDFFVTGTVVRGFQRGRTIGFPTANLETPETKVIPCEGVYTARVERGAQQYRAMVNIGKKPTFGQNVLTMEAHLLDFSENLYGEQIKVNFLKRIRDEKRFGSVEELRNQLLKDLDVAKKIKL